MLLVGFGSSSWAGTSTGIINPGWYVQTDGKLFFFLNATHVNPVCSISERWAFDVKTDVGKALMASFLTAYSTNRPVSINGTGTCDFDGNTEGVGAFGLQ
jgi:hypothetical protein